MDFLYGLITGLVVVLFLLYIGYKMRKFDESEELLWRRVEMDNQDILIVEKDKYIERLRSVNKALETQLEQFREVHGE